MLISAENFIVKHSPPKPEQFAHLRSLVGWNNPELAVLARSIRQSLYWVSVFCSEQLIGLGRVVGDGAMYFYIQDIIVHPHFQDQKVGSLIMQSINHYLNNQCEKGATVGLFAAKGKEAFYQQFGYCERDGETLGLGMCRFI